MRTLSDEDISTVELYFSNAIIEMQEGLPKYILEEILEHYEEQELYLACAGIKKALDWYQTNTFTKVLLKIEEIKENNKLN
tara:strand:- start:1648 stop:1890 length:243 start_codon:yes stop_codon:yes gene_type:complete